MTKKRSVIGLLMLMACFFHAGQCLADPAAVGIFEENQVGMAIPCVFGVWGDPLKPQCRGMVLEIVDTGEKLFQYDEARTWPAPCTADAAFALPFFNGPTGVLTVPVLAFGGKYFWAQISGFEIVDFGMYDVGETQ